MPAQTRPVPAAYHPHSTREGGPRRWLPLALVSISVAPRRERACERIVDPRQAAIDLAHFIAALQRINATGGPPPGEHNSFRGEPLAMRDERTREAIATLRGTLDVDAVTAVWNAAIEAAAWHGPPVWIHGDLQSGNLLVVHGRLCAVIDFGCLGVGDPACDVMAAWMFLSAETRDVFRDVLNVDKATWARGRGWALSVGLIALPYYQSTNPVLAGIARRAINETLSDVSSLGAIAPLQV